MNHMMYHKTIFNKLKKNETISSMFFNHNPTRLLEPNHKGKKKKLQKTLTWKLSNILLNNQWVTKETQRIIKILGNK